MNLLAHPKRKIIGSVVGGIITALSFIDIPGQLFHWTTFLRQNPVVFGLAGFGVIVLANWPWPEKAQPAMIYVDRGEGMPGFFKSKAKPPALPDKIIDVLPQRFHITLNKDIPDMSLEIVVVNYTNEPMHLSLLKVPWLQFGGAQTIKDIVATHVDIPARSAKTASCSRELTDAYIAALKKMTPPMGVMSHYENSALIVEYEGTIGNQPLPHHVINQIQVPVGEIAGLPYTLVKNSDLWRRYQLRKEVAERQTHADHQLTADRVYDGQLMIGTFEQVQMLVGLRRPDGGFAYVPVSNLIDVGPMREA